ncbi:hypothetical protein ACTXLV_14950 [Brachybacterium alimentarium]|uniref:hypothetical protein n=1 Tax=Brachybacterium alimentarium TaxID=47845 RepID=UPI003FD5E1FF
MSTPHPAMSAPPEQRRALPLTDRDRRRRASTSTRSASLRGRFPLDKDPPEG